MNKQYTYRGSQNSLSIGGYIGVSLVIVVHQQ